VLTVFGRIAAVAASIILAASVAFGFTTVFASNPSIQSNTAQPCPLEGQSYAAPYSGLTSYSQTWTGCTQSPWGATVDAYFWDGGWWNIRVYHPSLAYYSRTLYSAAVEGHHENFFWPVNPYGRTTPNTYAP
jgi:hypothetical protein